MVRLTRFFAAHRHPRLAAWISVTLSVATVAGTLLVALPSMDDVVSPTFFVLVGLGVVGTAFTRLLKVITGRPVEYGLSWFTPVGIVCILAAVFVHPIVVPVIATVILSTLRVVYGKHQQVKRTGSIAFAALVIPYMTAGVLVENFTSAGTHPLVWVAVFTLAIVVAEILNWTIVLSLTAMVNGEIRVPRFTKESIKPVIYMAIITLFVGMTCYFYDIVMATSVLAIIAGMAYFADQAIRNHQNFLGMRALSWGITTTALNFMEKLDDRTYRHSLSSARYTRDALRKWGFPKAAQDLGFMAGLLHKAGLTGVAKRLRIAEEEFIRDDLPPVPLPGEKTFDWNELRIVDPNDPMQHVIADAQQAAASTSGEESASVSENEVFSSASGEQEPAWWRPEEGKCLLSAQDIMTLDLYPAQTALLLEGASLYGGLPDIIEQHKKDAGQQRYTHQNPRIACCVASMLKIAVKYEALTAVDGSFPQKTPTEAIVILRECEEEFDSRALHAFIEMMNERPESYRNGTDLDYENPNEQLIEIFAADIPGPFDVKGWERYGQILQQKVDSEKAFVIQFAKDYLNHTAKQREQGSEDTRGT